MTRFKAYRPLLSSIKQALDLCVRDYRQALESVSGNKIAAVARKQVNDGRLHHLDLVKQPKILGICV